MQRTGYMEWDTSSWEDVASSTAWDTVMCVLAQYCDSWCVSAAVILTDSHLVGQCLFVLLCPAHTFEPERESGEELYRLAVPGPTEQARALCSTSLCLRHHATTSSSTSLTCMFCLYVPSCTIFTLNSRSDATSAALVMSLPLPLSTSQSQ